MLPMTISVFGCYSVILGTLYRIISQLLDRTHSVLTRDTLTRHAVICLLLAGIMPLCETLAYTGKGYCFDNPVGMWGLNVLIYGSWHFAALLFYTRWDTRPGQRASLSTTFLAGFATLAILMSLMATIETFIARTSLMSSMASFKSTTGALTTVWAPSRDGQFAESCSVPGRITRHRTLRHHHGDAAAPARADPAPQPDSVVSATRDAACCTPGVKGNVVVGAPCDHTDRHVLGTTYSAPMHRKRERHGPSTVRLS